MVWIDCTLNLITIYVSILFQAASLAKQGLHELEAVITIAQSLGLNIPVSLKSSLCFLLLSAVTKMTMCLKPFSNEFEFQTVVLVFLFFLHVQLDDFNFLLEF